MKLKLPLTLLAFSLGAAAQTLVGLPDYGVSLSNVNGEIWLVNGSHKPIIAAFADIKKEPGFAPIRLRAGYWNDAGKVRPGMQRRLAGARLKTKPGAIVSVTLYSLVFEDGQIVGTDPWATAEDSENSFQAFVETIVGMRTSLGKAAANGDWGQVRGAADKGNSHAKNLLDPHINGRDKDADDLAAQYQKTPLKLWR